MLEPWTGNGFELKNGQVVHYEMVDGRRFWALCILSSLARNANRLQIGTAPDGSSGDTASTFDED